MDDPPHGLGIGPFQGDPLPASLATVKQRTTKEVPVEPIRIEVRRRSMFLDRRDYVFLTEEDKSYLRELVKRSVALLAQDIPGNPPQNINALVV